MDAPKKKSRWIRAAKPPKLVITANDIEIFKLLYRYRYLPLNDIHAHTSLSLEHVRDRLQQLYDAGYLNRPAQQRENANANYTFMAYELDTKGATVLRNGGMPQWQKTAHRNFVHELMVNRIMCSMALGARENEARLITWPEILAADTTPRKTKEALKPSHIPCRIKTKKGNEESIIAADGEPFGIKSRAFFFFPGIEADCGTEPLSPADYDRSSIQRKFLAYIDICDRKLFDTHFGFPSFYVPFFFPTISRMESAMALLERLTASKPQLRRFFLFKVFPTLTTFGKQAPATGHVFEEPFLRAGLQPFSLIK